MLSDDEDWVARLKLAPEALAEMSAVKGTKKPADDVPRQPKRCVKGAFVLAEIEPLKAAAAALSSSGCPAMMVWLYLAFETRRRGTDTVQVSNVALSAWGVSRRVKYEALKLLEQAGLVSVRRDGKSSPRVRVNPYGYGD